MPERLNLIRYMYTAQRTLCHCRRMWRAPTSPCSICGAAGFFFFQSPTFATNIHVPGPSQYVRFPPRAHVRDSLLFENLAA